MINETPQSHHRATDPGGRVWSFGNVTWVHCPECDRAAKSNGARVSCSQCGYVTIPDLKSDDDKWVRVAGREPACHHCRMPLDKRSRPNGKTVDGQVVVRVKCNKCGQAGDYPAVPTSNPVRSGAYSPLRRYLETQVVGETLWVNNLAHLDALEDWIGAKVRERGSQPGLTMMARLPRWMKASTNREKVLRGLTHLRELAKKEGIDE